MARASLVFVVAACILAACFGEPVPIVGSASERNAAVSNTYYITTWGRFGTSGEHEQVANTVLGVQGLDELDGSQTVAFVIHGREGSAHSEFANEIRTVAACLGDPVPEVASSSGRNAAVVNTYYITTWDLISTGEDHAPVANTAEGVEALDYLDGTQNVAIVIHGRGGSAHSEFAYTLRDVLATADKTSAVFVVDWSAIAGGDYDQARNLVPQVAQDLSNFIVLLVEEEKLDLNLLHIIGFDLGAHVAGITSRITASRARKITALSPAGEGWDFFSLRLRSTDAQFVEVIHTDAVGNRAFGIVATERVGTLDFFPNGGTRQPGCSNSDNSCHHNRSWQLFAGTVLTGGHLIGTRCDTLAQALNNRCTGFGIAVMGTNEMIKSAQGIFRMNTGRIFPYGL